MILYGFLELAKHCGLKSFFYEMILDPFFKGQFYSHAYVNTRETWTHGNQPMHFKSEVVWTHGNQPDKF